MGRDTKPGGARGDAAFRLVLRRTDVQTDPLTTFAEIPAELTLPERELAHFYPLFTGLHTQWLAIFTKAPDQLFGYARVDVNDDGAGQGAVVLHAGEPVLVERYDDTRSLVHRFDGGAVTVRTDLLTTERPATIWLPTKPAVIEVTSERAEGAASLGVAGGAEGPEDAKAIGAYLKISDKYWQCYDKYMDKHDPTAHTTDEVYKISGGGRVTNVHDEVDGAADRTCGGKKLTKARSKLAKALTEARTARAVENLAAVRVRFGLKE